VEAIQGVPPVLIVADTWTIILPLPYKYQSDFLSGEFTEQAWGFHQPFIYGGGMRNHIISCFYRNIKKYIILACILIGVENA